LVTYTVHLGILITINMWNWNRDMIIGIKLKIGASTVSIHVALSIIEAEILPLFELVTKKT